jgi:pantetheine-phosphate adenylyltransferase
MKVALFPGSFDPITKGHENIIKRAIPLFDKIIIGIGINASKKHLFTLEQRMIWIEETFKDFPNVEVKSYSGLTIHFCKQIDANHIIRGLRNISDYNYESSIAQMNSEMDNSIETIFLQTTPALSAINSSIVRDIISNDGNASKFVPINIKNDFEK